MGSFRANLSSVNRGDQELGAERVDEKYKATLCSDRTDRKWMVSYKCLSELSKGLGIIIFVDTLLALIDEETRELKGYRIEICGACGKQHDYMDEEEK